MLSIMEKNKQKTIYNIGLALLKILMCFEVVIDHFKNWGNNAFDEPLRLMLMLYGSIAVPIFMISAFVLTGIEHVHDNSRIKKRFYRLLVPNFFWAVIYYATYYFFGCFDIIHGWTDFFWQIAFGHSYNQSLWFHSDLIVMTIIVILLFRFLHLRNAMLVSSVFAYIALYLQYSGINGALFLGINWPEQIWGGYFHKSYVTYPVGRFVEMVPYAVLGIFLGYYKVLETLKKSRNYIIIASVLCLYFFFSFSDYFIMPSGYGYQGMTRIIIALTTLVLFWLLPFDKVPRLINNAIVEISNHTMAIYFMHRIIAFIIYNTILNSFLNMKKGTIHDCIIIFCISLFVSLILCRIPVKFIRMSMS